MAGRGAGRGSKFFKFILFALLIINMWQVWRLNGEVSSLKGKVSAMKSHGESGMLQEKKAESALSVACKHADAGLKAASGGDVKRAKVEWEKSLKLMETAKSNTQTPYNATIEKIETSWKNTKR